MGYLSLVPSLTTGDMRPLMHMELEGKKNGQFQNGAFENMWTQDVCKSQVGSQSRTSSTFPSSMPDFIIQERNECPIPAFTLHVGNLLVVFLPVKASVANFNDLLNYDWYTAK